MRQLLFIRHAKSLHDAYVAADSERHLAPRGYVDAEDSAQWCKQRSYTPDLMISSPAIRAFSTALIFANRCGYPSDAIKLVTSIYEADSRKLLYVIREIDDRYQRVMIFGHNPGFSDIVNTLCGPVITHLPTAGVAVINPGVESWSEITPSRAKLIGVYSGHKDIG
ncbi:phosphohistidine phosphatase SixA [soil metagenome]